MPQSLELGVWDQVRAGILLEAELRDQFPAGEPQSAWPASVRFVRELPVLTRLSYVQSWLRYAQPERSDVVPVCEAVVAHICTIRDEDLGSSDELRRRFINDSRSIWSELQQIAVAAVESARSAGDDETARELECKLLYWAEQFENRLLLEELRVKMERAGVDEGHTIIDWQPGDWGLTQPWDRQELRVWDAQGLRCWMSDRLRRFVGSAGGELRSQRALDSSCLREVAVPREPETCESEYKVPSFGMFGSYMEPKQLHELLPDGAVWIRALFEKDGTLRWWAWMRSGTQLRRLASGQSQPDARTRLEQANLEFEVAVERAWDVYSSRRLDLGLTTTLELLTTAISDESFRATKLSARRDLQEFAQVIGVALGKLAGSNPTADNEGVIGAGVTNDARDQERGGNPALAVVGNQLLDLLFKSHHHVDAVPTWLWENWQQGLNALNLPSSRIDNRQVRCHRELDAATKSHVAAVQKELDLSALWTHTEGHIDWEQSDVIFQVKGPLLTAPLALLPFGGDQQLFERVASTSTAVSLTLRHYAELLSGDAMQPPRQLLSTMWEKPNNRQRCHGLPFLHAGLHRVSSDHGWEAWSLGDEPPASRACLTAALRQQNFGVVVIGAHGVNRGVGVALQDGLWRGDAADLSSVDLLVLVCCAVGRLEQYGNRDVEGLYTQLAVHGAKSVIAARWRIADLEAARLTVELVYQYLSELKKKGKVELFNRARAFNRARRRMLRHQDPEFRVSLHQIAAFDLYGLG